MNRSGEILHAICFSQRKRTGRVFDTRLAPEDAPACPPAMRKKNPAAVAYSGPAIAPAPPKTVARLQALRARLGMGLLPQSGWGQGA